MPQLRDHHVETYIADGWQDFGWQCFTCDAERNGYESFDDADAAARAHERFNSPLPEE